jgi:hypothetical protein
MFQEREVSDVLYREMQVRAGIAMLDQQVPGWREKFDPDDLHMSWASGCVLGQVFGGVGAGIMRLRLGPADIEEYGFFLPYPVGTDYFSLELRAQYDQLGDTWKALVKETATTVELIQRELVFA